MEEIRLTSWGWNFIPLFTCFFYISGGCLGCLPSTVWLYDYNSLQKKHDKHSTAAFFGGWYKFLGISTSIIPTPELFRAFWGGFPYTTTILGWPTGVWLLYFAENLRMIPLILNYKLPPSCEVHVAISCCQFTSRVTCLPNPVLLQNNYP